MQRNIYVFVAALKTMQFKLHRTSSSSNINNKVEIVQHCKYLNIISWLTFPADKQYPSTLTIGHIYES